ncbi:SusC/RagA family TonB-linked outer membrane protein [Rapidithrix thailandica]|uniref:SusC/RagA family TonB-linked outer membrane protein n=1 Tax=Rapidithrix thailandica TaxID=413964 RepID=A0AAW9S2S0_9BACT
MIQRFLLFITLLFSGFCQAQESVTGKVFSRVDKEPLPGVNILIKGSLQGTVSGLDGSFSLLARPSDTLLFSIVGYERESVALNGRTQLQVSLPEKAAQLKEVTVYSTGYQQLSRERATGSFERLDREQLNRRVSTGILSRMEDISPGLVFHREGRERDFSIRGRSTLSANARPLIVVDNFPYEGDLSSLNPNDVESITVLKDAAAASIWGARAGNGVVVITTRKGKVQPKPRFSLTSHLTVIEKPDLFYPSRMSSEEFLDMEQWLFTRGFYKSAENSPRRTPLTPGVELLIAQREGKLSKEALEEEWEKLTRNEVRKDFERYFYRPALQQQYALQLRGGTSLYRYFISLGLDNNLESLQENSRERYSLSARNTWHVLNQKLEISLGVYGVQSQWQLDNPGPGSVRLSANAPVYPYARLQDGVIRDYRKGFVEQASNQGLLDWHYRPLDELSASPHSIRATDLRLTGGLQYLFPGGLKASVLSQYFSSDKTEEQLHPLASYYTRDLINQYTERGKDGELQRHIPLGGILDQRFQKTISQNLRFQLTYEKNWKQHQLSLLAGYEVREQVHQSTVQRLYGYDPELTTHQPVDYQSRFPRYHYPASKARIPHRDGVSLLTDRFLSSYANASYTFRDRYTFSASVRKDASNLFGVRANQKGVPLWSAGLAWTLSEEAFMKPLDLLKLRLTYGYNGNLDRSVSAYTTATRFGSNVRYQLPYAVIANPPNPDLRWERVRILNAGLDFATRGNRLSGSVEYFAKWGMDLIGQQPLPPSSGMNHFRGNSASTFGQGIDLKVKTLNLKGAFQWQTNWLFSWIKEKVSRYEVPALAKNYIQSGATGLYPLEGKPLYGIYSYRWAGLDPQTGDPRGYLEGQASTDYAAVLNATNLETMVYQGPARPVCFGAFRNTFSFKGLSLSINLTYRLGYYFRKNSIRYNNLLSGNVEHGDYRKRWQQPGDETFTQVPSLPERKNTNRDQLYLYSEALVEKGDHLRLQDIRLEYQLPIEKLPFHKAKVYLYANHLGILWKATGTPLDPDYRQTKPQRSLSLGFQLEF